MKEQLVAQKVGNRSGIGQARRSSSSSQKPARRDRAQGRRSASERFRGLLAYVPLFLKIVVAIGIGVLLFTGYRAAASASFFQLRKVEVQGTSRASLEDLQALVRREVSAKGVWQTDLNELTAKLERLPWVRRATVSRVLPDGVRIRVVERVPLAVVRTGSGRFRWVDEDAVLLGEMNPADQMPPFFLRGLSEEDSETARVENVERVRQFRLLQEECNAAGISERVSEVNVAELHDVRAQLAGDDSRIELRLGAKDRGALLKRGLAVLDEERSTPLGPCITYIIMDQKVPIVGHSAACKKLSSESIPSDKAAATPQIEKKPKDKTARR